MKPFDFITSDHHFFHNNIIRLCDRPFGSGWHMIEEFVERWNSVIGEEAVVWHLGDFSLSTTNLPTLLPRLNGKIALFVGNHDKVWKAITNPDNQKQYHWVEEYLSWGFTSIGLNGQTMIGKHKVEFGHLPYRNTGDRGYTERYAEHRIEDRGLPMLHGHSHLKKGETLRHTSKGTLMIDIGVDGHDFYPYSYEEVLQILDDNA